ncbi:hypothetical protein HME9302_01265 [Alteripontixanthobacter maritimus]|uniref:CDP-glycerol glycerophosphotransferase n=1 Tax=Alteripontixanthobacter maritimus TaxID=2161824 RepID=A0A369QA34_9SPHN|nr:hypothetical protein [Alteripontixanthobacter maritimus]RDC60066.1 hypothetical protein HME9302_01265 [Alteripontixanthobacter maritimus]
MRLAFLYIAETYQAYHCAAVMLDLMARPDVDVDVYYIDPATPHTLELLRQAHGAPAFPMHHMEAGWLGKAIQRVRLLGLAKPQVLAANEERLRGYDAVISTEDGIADLFAGEPENQRPSRILITHGAGGRAVPSFSKRVHCDLLLLKGEADAAYYVRHGLSRPGHVAAAGYTKFASSRALARAQQPLFPNDNPVVLYNPHKDRKQRSWDRFFEPMMAAFRQDDSRNLIVAPHTKLFKRRSEQVRQRLRDRSTDTIIVDPASPRLLDNSYTEASGIYVGDVSSQVYEFTIRPRPCVFLNAHGVDWRGDPHYAFWQMGEVVDDPGDLMAAIERAPALHNQFRNKQVELTALALGETSDDVVPRAADWIVEYVRNGKIAT